MAQAAKLEFDRDLKRLFRRLADPTPALREFGEYKASAIKRGFQHGPRSAMAMPGTAPFTRSGQRGIVGSIVWVLRGLLLLVGTNKVYGRMLQFGGIQRPRRARTLAVPVHARAYGKRPRDFELEFIPAQNPTAYRGMLARVTRAGTSREQIEPYFLLLTRVRIRPHPYLLWLRNDLDKLLVCLQRLIDRR